MVSLGQIMPDIYLEAESATGPLATQAMLPCPLKPTGLARPIHARLWICMQLFAWEFFFFPNPGLLRVAVFFFCPIGFNNASDIHAPMNYGLEATIDTIYGAYLLVGTYLRHFESLSSVWVQCNPA